MVQGKRKWGIGPIKEFIEQHGLREKFDALTPPNVAAVAYRDASFKFYIPDAMTDKMQLAPLLGSHTAYFVAIMKARWVQSFEPQAHLIDVIKKH